MLTTPLYESFLAFERESGVDFRLFGEAMERSLNALKPFGRFVELGKRDYVANTHIGLRPFRLGARRALVCGWSWD